MEYTTRILIADESQSQRATLREGLTRAGYRHIEEASNGEEALARVTRNHPDIVLMDVWLSKMDGIGVLRSIQNMDFSPDRTPSVIMMSTVSSENIFIQASHAGAEMCLLKPIHMVACAITLRKLPLSVPTPEFTPYLHRKTRKHRTLKRK